MSSKPEASSNVEDSKAKLFFDNAPPRRDSRTDFPTRTGDRDRIGSNGGGSTPNSSSAFNRDSRDIRRTPSDRDRRVGEVTGRSSSGSSSGGSSGGVGASLRGTIGSERERDRDRDRDRDKDRDREESDDKRGGRDGSGASSVNRVKRGDQLHYRPRIKPSTTTSNSENPSAPLDVVLNPPKVMVLRPNTGNASTSPASSSATTILKPSSSAQSSNQASSQPQPSVHIHSHSSSQASRRSGARHSPSPSNREKSSSSSSSSSTSTTSSSVNNANSGSSSSANASSSSNSSLDKEKVQRDKERDREKQKEADRKAKEKQKEKERADKEKKKKDDEKERQRKKKEDEEAAIAAKEAKRVADELEEKRRKEAEERKLQEEKDKAIEDEKRRKEEKERALKATAEKYEEEKKSLLEKEKLREENIKAYTHRPPLGKTLDASIKKVTAFRRKVKMLCEHKGDELVKELEKLNLTKYISEVVKELCEAKLAKQVDVAKCVLVSSRMHQLYAEFSPQFIPSLQRLLGIDKDKDKKPKTEKTEAVEPSVNPPRVVLRLLTELYVVGIHHDSKCITKYLERLMNEDTGNDPDYVNLHMVVSFGKYGAEDFWGVLGRKHKAALAEAGLPYQPKPFAVSVEQRQQCLAAVQAYALIVRDRVAKNFIQLHSREKQNTRMLFIKGEVPESLVDRLSKMKESFEKLQTAAISLVDMLDEDPIVLPEIVDDPEDDLSAIISSEGRDPTFVEKSLFDDEDTRQFYETLPDLRLVVPPVLLEEGMTKEKAKEIKKVKEDHLKKDEGEKAPVEEPAAAAAAVVEEPIPGMESLGKLLDIDSDKYDSVTEADFGSVPEPEVAAEEEEEEEVREKKSHPLELLLAGLPSAFNREAVDQIAEKFCYLNSKSARKRLVRVCYMIPRNQQDLLPYYSRLIAILAVHFKDIGEELVTLLVKEFYGLLKKKDQINIDTRLKNIRFLSELVKFKVAPSTVIFRCWHACLLGFTPHNIQVCCAMLENCGRWLYRNGETHVRCTKFLERMTKLQQSKFLDTYHLNLIENAYYQCRPSSQSAVRRKKERSPLHLYIRHLLYVQLNPNTSEAVLKSMRKLPWDAECTHLVLKCLVNIPGNVKFSYISEVADVASGLAKYHKIGVPLVDAVLEHIRCGLETNYPDQKQRRLCYVKYLGELFIFFLADVQIILDCLYLLITFGHSINKNGELESALDPPDDHFRMHLVNCLLLTCSDYFDHANTRKLERFLCYFERYCFLKETVPIDVEMMLADLFERVRPKWKRAKTREEATKRVADIENDHSNASDRLMTMEQFYRQGHTQTMGLANIFEDEEDDEGDEGDMSDEGDDGHDDDMAHDDSPNQSQDAEDKARSSQPIYGGQEETPETAEEGGQDDHEVDVWARSNTKGPEDDDFIKELERMVQEDVEARKYEKGKSNLVPVEAMTMTGALIGKDPGVRIEATVDEDGMRTEHVVFKVMTRMAKGGGKEKTQAHELMVPLECEFAQNTLTQEQEQREEKANLKRLVLEGLEGQAEEEFYKTNFGGPLNDDSSVEFRPRGQDAGRGTRGRGAARATDPRLIQINPMSGGRATPLKPGVQSPVVPAAATPSVMGSPPQFALQPPTRTSSTGSGPKIGERVDRLVDWNYSGMNFPGQANRGGRGRGKR